METREEVGGSVGPGEGLHSGAAEKRQAGMAKGLVETLELSLCFES